LCDRGLVRCDEIFPCYSDELITSEIILESFMVDPSEGNESDSLGASSSDPPSSFSLDSDDLGFSQSDSSSDI
jgi:hypothetical protein